MQSTVLEQVWWSKKYCHRDTHTCLTGPHLVVEMIFHSSVTSTVEVNPEALLQAGFLGHIRDGCDKSDALFNIYCKWLGNIIFSKKTSMLLVVITWPLRKHAS